MKRLKKSLTEKDIDIFVEDMRKIRNLLAKRASGEMSDKELEEIAGRLTPILGGILMGFICAGAMTGVAGAAYHISTCG